MSTETETIANAGIGGSDVSMAVVVDSDTDDVIMYICADCSMYDGDESFSTDDPVIFLSHMNEHIDDTDYVPDEVMAIVQGEIRSASESATEIEAVDADQDEQSADWLNTQIHYVPEMAGTLQPTDTRLDRSVTIVLRDNDGSMYFRHAFARFESDGIDNWVVVYTRRHGYHVFSRHHVESIDTSLEGSRWKNVKYI